MKKYIDSRLNVLRTLTALYVVLHHLFRNAEYVGTFFAFGQEAVMIFFVLSGRVIHISEYQKARKTWEFYRVRLWRIYPPLIAMLLLTTLMKFFGLIENKINFAELIGTLLSIQDIASLKQIGRAHV